MQEYVRLGVEWVANALDLSDFLEVDETKSKVRRRTEVTEPKDQFQRSVYAKGFGEEHANLQQELEELFDKYGRVNAVRMRRDQDKKFKGSVFTEFSDFTSVDKFLNCDPKPSWDGSELLIMSKEAYCNMKIKEKGLKGKAAETRKEIMNNRGFNAFRMVQGKGSSSSSSSFNSKGSEKEVYLDFLGHKIRIYKDESGNGTIKEEDVPLVRGATLRFDGGGETITWADIKDPLKQKFDGKAPFIQYTPGKDYAFVGFHKVLSEDDIALVKETVKTLNSREVNWSNPDEESEKAFLVERAKTAARSAFYHADHGQQRSSRGGGRGRGRGGRGGRGGGRGGRRGGGGRDSKAGNDDEQGAGEKRKRAVEPDGGPDVGVRGNNAPPVLQAAAKKVKANDGEAVLAGTSS
ncbi:hypothetical protein AX17_003786 [Amanita inopinata Kibby_2008]|nr:hypothetical protein AX17_003786 [Amanita inopinata Kibby_2008]